MKLPVIERNICWCEAVLHWPVLYSTVLCHRRWAAKWVAMMGRGPGSGSVEAHPASRPVAGARDAPRVLLQEGSHGEIFCGADGVNNYVCA